MLHGRLRSHADVPEGCARRVVIKLARPLASV